MFFRICHVVIDIAVTNFFSSCIFCFMNKSVVSFSERNSNALADRSLDQACSVSSVITFCVTQQHIFVRFKDCVSSVKFFSHSL